MIYVTRLAGCDAVSDILSPRFLRSLSSRVATDPGPLPARVRVPIAVLVGEVHNAVVPQQRDNKGGTVGHAIDVALPRRHRPHIAGSVHNLVRRRDGRAVRTPHPWIRSGRRAGGPRCPGPEIPVTIRAEGVHLPAGHLHLAADTARCRSTIQ